MSKTWYGIILAVAIASGCATTDGPGEADAFADTDLSFSRKVALTVHGLSCPLCSNNLDGQLANIDGVEDVSINLKTGTVTVRLAQDHSVTAADIAAAVKNAGFTLKAIKPGSFDQ